MKFRFFNDTGRVVTIHEATYAFFKFQDTPIQPLETRDFESNVANGIPCVKMWDYGERWGLQIFVYIDAE